MSVATVITEGFGGSGSFAYGSVAGIVCEGYVAGGATAKATILTQAFGASSNRSAFLVAEGFGLSTPTPTPTPTPTGQVDTPVGGRLRRLPTFKRELESESEKLARRIREGTIQPEPVPALPKDDSAYFREAARLAKAIAAARADAETSRQAIARYKQREELLRQSAVVQGKLLRAEQALLLAQVTEAALMEEMEVIDIAYLAVAVLSMILQ